MGNLDGVHLLVEYAMDVNATEKDGRTPLFLALERGHLDSRVRVRIRTGPKVAQKSRSYFKSIVKYMYTNESTAKK